MSIEAGVTDATSPERDLDLTACDREPIHIPGSIQPHGLLLITDSATLTVVGGAGEIEERLAADWLGRPLCELLGQDVGAAAVQATAVPGAAQPLAPVGTFTASLFRAGDHLLVELEPMPDEPMSAATILARLDAIGTAFERAGNLQALCERAASGFRELTGFDRVMIYRFLDDAAGVVMAEDRDPSLHSFLNHHFPATDIPRQARELYIRNRVRVIPDIAYRPAPIRPADAALATIDLSDSILRSVSPIHLQYLHNMGVQASASVSIVKDGLLWGMVACHNSSPRGLGFEQRAACRALAGGLARQIRAKEEAETYRERIRLRQAEDNVVGNVDLDMPFAHFFEVRGDQIRQMLDADGFAVIGPKILTFGTVPPIDAIQELARWAETRAATETFATPILSQRFAPATAYREVASGMLAVSLATEASSLLMWFRVEQPETVEWAGNPHKNRSDDPNEQLTPRNSFEAWRETVRGRARRWTIAEVEAATRFRRVVSEHRQGRRLRELNRELSATIADREALLAEKDHLLREGNHRVQNSLQLVQAFLALQAREKNVSPEVVEHLNEAQRRLAAVALVHRRLYQAEHVEAVDLSRYLEELIRDMMSSMGAGWHNQIRTDLAPVLVPATRAVNIGLILTELVINANKYAYDGGAGPITISLEPYRNQLRLIVADEGKGKSKATSPEAKPRVGFGTRMMQAMVQRLGGTIESYDNEPGLRVILTAPVED